MNYDLETKNQSKRLTGGFSLDSQTGAGIRWLNTPYGQAVGFRRSKKDSWRSYGPRGSGGTRLRLSSNFFTKLLK